MRTFFLCLLVLVPALLVAAQEQPAKSDDAVKLLAALLKAVKQTDNIDARVQAIIDLGDIGPKAAPAVPDLLNALQTKNHVLRLNAALTLSRIGKPAVKPVAQLLRAKDADTRLYAIWTIGWIGPDARETIPVMIELLADKNEAVRRKAAFALGRLESEPSDRVLAALASACTDANAEVRQAAGDALVRFGRAAAPTLIELLGQKSPKGRRQAAATLGDIGADAGDAVAPLLDRCLANDSENRGHYAAMLVKVGRGGLPALATALKDPRSDVRTIAAETLGKLGAPGTPVLVDGLGDKNVEVRRLSAFTLMGTLGTSRNADKATVLALGFGLADEDDVVRVHCISALQGQPQAHLVSAKIKDALTDMNFHVRVQAYQLLGALGENVNGMMQKKLESKNDRERINTAALMCSVNFMRADAVPILAAGLKNDNLSLRMQAAHALGLAGLERDKVLPVFLAGFTHKWGSVRAQAVEGLGWHLDAGADAVSRVASALGDADARVRQQAVHVLHAAIKKHHVEARTVVPTLEKHFALGDAEVRKAILQVAWIYGESTKGLYVAALKDKDARVRLQGLLSVVNRTEERVVFLPALIPLVKDESQLVREQLVPTLQRIGEAAVACLGELLQDEDESVRRAASQALVSMGPKAAKALPNIKAAIKDDNATVRIHALVLLAQVGGGGPALLAKQFRAEPDPAVRAEALLEIAALPDKTRGAPLLKLGITDPALEVRHMTLNVLGQFGQGSREGVEVFALALQDAELDIRLISVGFAGWYGEQSWGPLAAALLTAKEARMRAAILEGLTVTKYRDKASVPILIDCLKDQDVAVRIHACNVLGNIGPEAAKALPSLRERTTEDFPVVREAARAAVKNIEAPKR
jgi:HEAT repeat protein